MPWGKYRGCELIELPSSYLAWLVEDADATRPALRHAASTILGERFGANGRDPVVVRVPVQIPTAFAATARELIAAGVRGCARRRHPDTGGSHAAMLELTAAAEALRKCVP